MNNMNSNAVEIDKSILIKNDTSDAKVTLFIYSTLDPICRLSSSSKIIEPGEKYLYRSEDSFKFELRAHREKSKRKIIHSLTKWEKAAVFIVTGCIEDSEEDSNVKVEEKNLADFPQENLICIRRQNMEKEISADYGRNLYEVLKLNIKDVRKAEKEKQNEMIEEAYDREKQRWGRDRPEGDENMCQEINFAYSILGDPEKRAKYNNVADYDNGWLSKSRWKSIIFPDYNSKEQRSQHRKRLVFLAVSAGLLLSSVILAIFTAGLAIPIAVLSGAGIQSGLRSITRESIKNGCDTKKYMESMVIGAITGALTGGAAAGITGLVDIGSGALQATEVTMGEYISVGSARGAAVGAISSVAADIKRKFVNGEDISLKKIAVHAVIGVVIGAVAGVARGAVTKAVVGPAMSASAENLEGEAIEQMAIGANLGSITEGITGNTLETAAIVTEERQNNSVENKSLGEHCFCAALKTAKHAGKNAILVASKEVGDACTGNGTDPYTTNSNLEQSEVDEDGVNLTKTKKTLPEEKSQKLNSEKKCEVPDPPYIQLGCNNGKEEQYYQDANIFARIHSCIVQIDPEADPNPKDGANTETGGRIRYISEGDWISKLIVQYTNDENEMEKKEVSGSRCSIVIPEKAKNIEVKFQVLRSCGGNAICHAVKGNKNQSKTNSNPEQIEVDQDERQIKLSKTGKKLPKKKRRNPNSKNKCEMPRPSGVQIGYSSNGQKKDKPINKTDAKANGENVGRIRYFSEGAWVSKLIVQYTNDKNEMEKKIEVSGSGSSIVLQEKPKIIEVKFQVLRSCGGNAIGYSSNGQKKDKPINKTDAKANGENVGRIRYISEGAWISKLIVQYTNDINEMEKKEVKEVSGSGSSIVIPEKAKNIEVRFQVLRFIGIWRDVKKYDRFQKCWWEPVEPHIFKYDKPPIRTFTIKGGLYYEAVMKVTNEYYDEVRVI